MKQENKNKFDLVADALCYDSAGIVPLIVQDAEGGTVLSLFYANQDAVCRMLETGYVWRYSRQKKRLIKKGEESGNFMKIVSIVSDCDLDALLVRVKIENNKGKKGVACHTGAYSCFGSSVSCSGSSVQSFAILSELTAVLTDRKKNPKPGSYTSKILGDSKEIIAKIREECEEFIEAGEIKKEKKEIVWEAADLLFFMLVYLENQGVGFEDVLKELKRRRK